MNRFLQNELRIESSSGISGHQLFIQTLHPTAGATRRRPALFWSSIPFRSFVRLTTLGKRGEGTDSSRCDNDKATGMSIACPALGFFTVLAWPEFLHSFKWTAEAARLQFGTKAPPQRDRVFNVCIICNIYMCVCVFTFRDINVRPTTRRPWSCCILTCTNFKCRWGDRWWTPRPLEINPLQNGGILGAQGIWVVRSNRTSWPVANWKLSKHIMRSRHIFRINLPTVAICVCAIRAQFNGNLPIRTVCKPKLLETIPWNHNNQRLRDAGENYQTYVPGSLYVIVFIFISNHNNIITSSSHHLIHYLTIHHHKNKTSNTTSSSHHLIHYIIIVIQK